MGFLEIKDLHVSVGEKEIIKGISISVDAGRTAVIFGPNGSGKSTLLGTIAGLPGYEVTSGTIIFKGQDLTRLSIDERSRLGIGLSYQYPPAIKGVRLQTLLENINADRELIASRAESLNMTDYLCRDVNVGFSGGERKRSEVLQMMLQNPDLMLFDEPESGVDIENISVISNAVRIMLEKDKPISKRSKSAIIITHTGFILDYVRADIAFVIMDGHVLGCGAPGEIFEEIKKDGYKNCASCFADRFQEIITGDEQ